MQTNRSMQIVRVIDVDFERFPLIAGNQVLVIRLRETHWGLRDLVLERSLERIEEVAFRMSGYVNRAFRGDM